MIPRGTGSGYTVSLFNGGRHSNDNSNSSAAVTFSYQPPRVLSAEVVKSPSSATSGTQTIRVVGSSFSSAPNVTIAGAPCVLQSVAVSHDSLLCVTPSDYGAQLPLVVSAGGQRFVGASCQLQRAASYSLLATACCEVVMVGHSCGPVWAL